MFLVSIITYIIGLLVYFVFVVDSLYKSIFLLICLLLISCLIILFRKVFTIPYKYLFIFFTLGYLFAFISIYFNKTVLIEEKMAYETIFGEIYKIEKSSYDTKQHIYLKNVVFPAPYKDIYSPEFINLKLSYQRFYDIQDGDIIKATAYIFPPSDSLLPFSTNFKRNIFAKKISGNGYILGDIQVIRSSQTSYGDFYLYFKKWRNQIRENIKNNILANASKNVAPFLIAISIGEYAFLPKEDLLNLQKTALAHLISISGYHISIISALLFFGIRFCITFIPAIVLRYDSKKISSIITISFMLFYIFIIGNHIPALRATIMSVTFLVAIIFNFQVISFSSLFLAGAVILSLSPYSLFSASFLLSFFATMSLIFFWNLNFVKNLNNESKRAYWLRLVFFIFFSMIATLFIELSIFPILAHYFGMIPINGVFSNTIASPIFSFLVMPFLLGYFITPIFIGKYFLIISEFGMNLILKIAKFFYDFGFAVYYTDFFSGNLLFWTLVSYTTSILLKNRYSLIFISFWFILLTSYFITPKPNILISYDGNNIAIKEGIDDSYYYNESDEKFVKSFWVKNPNENKSKTLDNLSSSTCENFHCVFKVDNITLSLSNNLKYFQEDCGYVDIILVPKSFSIFDCNKGKIIDKNFLNKNGSAMIYIKKDKITLFSVKENYLSTLIKNFLQ